MHYNEYEEHTLEELRSLLEKEQERLEELLAEPQLYYIPGDSMTYMSAMSQYYAFDRCRDTINALEEEINRRCRATKEE